MRATVGQSFSATVVMVIHVKKHELFGLLPSLLVWRTILLNGMFVPKIAPKDLV